MLIIIYPRQVRVEYSHETNQGDVLTKEPLSIPK